MTWTPKPVPSSPACLGTAAGPWCRGSGLILPDLTPFSSVEGQAGNARSSGPCSHSQPWAGGADQTALVNRPASPLPAPPHFLKLTPDANPNCSFLPSFLGVSPPWFWAHPGLSASAPQCSPVWLPSWASGSASGRGFRGEGSAAEESQHCLRRDPTRLRPCLRPSSSEERGWERPCRVGGQRGQALECRGEVEEGETASGQRSGCGGWGSGGSGKQQLGLQAWLVPTLGRQRAAECSGCTQTNESHICKAQTIFHHLSQVKKQMPGFPGGPVVKNLPCNERNTSSTPGQGRCHTPRGN